MGDLIESAPAFYCLVGAVPKRLAFGFAKPSNARASDASISVESAAPLFEVCLFAVTRLQLDALN